MNRRIPRTTLGARGGSLLPLAAVAVCGLLLVTALAGCGRAFAAPAGNRAAVADAGVPDTDGAVAADAAQAPARQAEGAESSAVVPPVGPAPTAPPQRSGAGTPPNEAEVGPSPAALRAFEESEFPRDVELRVPPPEIEGASAPVPLGRPGAQNPPEPLRSARHRRMRGVRPDRQLPKWVRRLVLPDLPARWDEKVLRYLEYFRDTSRGRALMRYWLRRQGRYAEMISRVLRAHGLPQALLYVSMIESSYDPSLTSRMGAAGLWQFMTHSGRGYGLKRDFWVDERRNPKRSTEAAARHLKDLRARFGSWELALAAYNAGSGIVIDAMQKYNTNDYWQLCRYEAGLPWSTSLYVPKIYAAAVIGLNRAFFGFADVQPDPAIDFELVAVSRSVRVSAIARAVGAAQDAIEELNPELRRGRTPPAGKVWVRVPRGTASAFYERMKATGRARQMPYRVLLGDTLQRIAERFGARQSALRQINGIRDVRELKPGLTILVPAGPLPPVAKREADRDLVVVALPPGSPERVRGRKRVFYRTVAGDTLRRIARHLQVTVEDLAAWNGLDPRARLVSAMVLQAFVPQAFDDSRVRLVDPDRIQLMVAGSEEFLKHHLERNGRRRLIYRARRGDTLRRLSRRFRISVGSLMRINQIPRSAQLTEGQRLVIYTEVRKARAASRRTRARVVAEKRDTRGNTERKVYEVRPGDTLTHIGRRFGISVASLLQSNGLSLDSPLKIGQRLVIGNAAPKRAAGRSKGDAPRGARGAR